MAVSGFPMGVVEELIVTMVEFFPDRVIVDRPLRPIDANRSIGVFVADWSPDQDSFQIGQVEPAVNRYAYRIHNMVKSFDEALGRSMFSLDAKSIRVVLYRDPTLLVRLAALNEVILGSQERFKRMKVLRQRFVNTAIKRELVYVATTDLLVETETVQL